MARIRRWVVAVPIVSVVVGMAIYAAALVWTARAEVNRFKETFPAAAIIGRTTGEVTARYGKPDGEELGPGLLLMTYKSHQYGVYCVIEFRNGVATAVRFTYQ